jgi:HEAT repeat protein
VGSLEKRVDNRTEEELRQQLAQVTEVGLGRLGPRVARAYKRAFLAKARAVGEPGLTDPSPLLEVVPPVRQLGPRGGADRQLPAREAKTLETLARKMKAYLQAVAPVGPDGRRPAGAARDLLERLRDDVRRDRPEWLRDEAVPAMVQLLMGEATPYRRVLVEMLAATPGKKSTAALVQRAVFDLDAGIRGTAVGALRSREAALYRPPLLKALRYPWAPAAEHAAEALVALGDHEAVAALVTLLSLPDPAAPRPGPGKAVLVTEVVRVNHLTNCVMCHPPAFSQLDPVLGVDPVLDNQQNSETGGGCGSGGSARLSAAGSGTYSGLQTSSGLPPLLLRGDITFLRQDLSVQQPVGQPALRALPGVAAGQPVRFDYLVRTRDATRSERADLRAGRRDASGYPQRDAVLFALKELTGKDPGPAAEAWQELYPLAKADAAATRLGDQLAAGPPQGRGAAIAKLRQGEGPAYTEALARALPELRGETRENARGALAERLAREPFDDLCERCKDADAEVRRAAAAALGRKGDKAAVPELVALLDDPDPAVVPAAQASLKQLTGQSHATPAAWKEWWKKQVEVTARLDG